MEEYTNEEWRDVAGYEGLYMVSNYGRVKSLPRVYRSGRSHSLIKMTEERLLSIDQGKNGYISVALTKNANTKRFLVHRLVAQAFIQNPDNLPCINHLDRDRSNNSVDNLEWCTQQQNLLYPPTRKAISASQTNGGHSKSVIQYTLDGEFVQEWPSTREIQRKLGYFQTNISSCCLGKYKQAYGYLWRYKYSEK